MTDSVIRKYESGAIIPRYEALERMGLALGVEPYRLMTGAAAVDESGQTVNEMLTSLKEYKTKLSESEEAIKAVLPDLYDKLNIKGKDRAIQQV